MFKLAFRNIFRQKALSLLTLMAIILGVTGLLLSGGFVEDVFYQLREATIHSHLGHIQVYRSGYSKEGRRDPFGLRPAFGAARIGEGHSRRFRLR